MTLELNNVLPASAADTAMCNGTAVSATIHSGEALLVEAPEGWGKTVLARTLLGMWPLAEGCVSIDAEPVTSRSATWLRQFTGYVPQQQPEDVPSVFVQLDELRVSDKHIIILDTPTALEDPYEQEQLREIVGSLQQAGKTVVWLRRGEEFKLEML